MIGQANIRNISLSTFLGCVLVWLSVSGVQVSQAQSSLQSPSQTLSDELITFSQLGIKDQTLRGPFDAAYLEFGLPADWQATGDGELQLDINSLLLGGDPTQTDSATLTRPSTRRSTGLINIKLNDVTIGNLPLGAYGKQNIAVTVPISAWVSSRSDGLNFIYVELVDYPRCDRDEQVVMYLQATSRLRLPHRIAPLQPNFRHLPRPFYQRALQPDIATLVIPDRPSADELQAAMDVAAGFGRMTLGNLGLTLTTASQLQSSGQITSHLILVGKVGAFGEQFAKATWPVAPQQTQFKDVDPGDGVLQIVSSPWDDSRALLWVGGETDEGLLKAARALSTGMVRALTTPNVAIVSNTRPPTATADLPTDFDLADLGYGIQEFSGPGIRYTNYQFHVPDNMRAKSDAYFELNFVHSALLDYASSGLIVTLNGEYVGSVRFDDSSTLLNKERIPLPANSIRNGNNDLGVQVDLTPRNRCGNSSRLWASIRPDSQVHLPLVSAPTGNDDTRINLSRYPKPFNTQPDLSHLAFVLGLQDTSGWRTAAHLAFQLGQNSAQQPLDIAVLFGDTTDTQRRDERNLIIVGRPTQLPMLELLTDALPAPFLPGSDMAIQPNAVEYRVAKNADVGYVQLLTSPWNEQRVILAVLGNTEAGLQQALNSLVSPRLRSQLNGNFALINNDQVYAEEVRVRQAVVVPTVTPMVTVEPVSTTPGTPIWLLPAVAISIGSLFILLSVVGFWWARRRRHSPSPPMPPPEPPLPVTPVSPASPVPPISTELKDNSVASDAETVLIENQTLPQSTVPNNLD